MQSLARVLKVKILITLIMWCVPLLALPRGWFGVLGMPAPQPMVFVRLLGVAYLALLVGYSFGLIDIRNGRLPTGVVWTGMASNGLASAVLLVYGFTGSWSTWSLLGRVYMWVSALATLCIAILLFRHRR